MKFVRFLFSGIFMAILLIIFATAIAYATFIENDYDPAAARLLVYNAKWFEAILLLMVVNFTGMIFTRRLYVKSQWNVLLIHLALIIVIIGAGITRYYGFEGTMHIREGQETDLFASRDHYVDLTIRNGKDTVHYSSEKIILSAVKEGLYSNEFDLNGQELSLEVEAFYPNAQMTLEPSDTGPAYLSLIVGSSDGRHEISLKEGEAGDVHGFGFSFADTTVRNALIFQSQNDSLFMNIPEQWMAFANLTEEQWDSVRSPIHVQPMMVYSFGATSWVLQEYTPHGRIVYKPSADKNVQGARVVRTRINGQRHDLVWGEASEIAFGDLDISLAVGYKALVLPFKLRLRDFDMERYAGSNSPSSYASEVTVVDEDEGEEFDFRIFMNNILSYRGYRFYQSSYDQDEQGTVLSVNQDRAGTVVTYVGYFLLFLSLLLSFFTRRNRFARLVGQLKMLQQEQVRRFSTILLFSVGILLPVSASSQDLVLSSNVSEEHASRFGTLQVQSQEGRVMPMNTLASQALVKMYKKDRYQDMSGDQVFIHMILDVEKWQKEPVIKVENQAVQSLIGITGEYASFSDFLDNEGMYILKQQVDAAFQKSPALRTQFDKDLININERANVCYTILNGGLLKIFPVKDDPNNRWAHLAEIRMNPHGSSVSGTAEYDTYIELLKQAISSGDYSEADGALDALIEVQKVESPEIVLSESKIKWELTYNKYNVFKRLFPVYFLVGLLLTGLFFIRVFASKFSFSWLRKVLLFVLFAAFIIHTGGLILRWYVSGHAPWSNGYESMIYISWATMFSGLLFARRSLATLSVTSVLSGIILLTAHMSWMNPEITNLVPVLKSYWLTIHVATITASYGFLGMAAMLGFLNLILLIFKKKGEDGRVEHYLKEIGTIMELGIHIGLVLLVIGNFLGGIWANESWGRYWGWDPKETWTLVTIVVYSFILHTTLVPGLKNPFSFNLLSLWGIGTILMTYFGVNYFLSGLHSYAGGDPVAVPTFVYYLLVIFGLISLVAGINYYRTLVPEEEPDIPDE